MIPHYSDDTVTLHHGDCLDILRELPDASVDAVCTDPPYALEFMGKTWDGWSTPAAFQEWCGLWAAECLRVLKPGGHMLAFGGSRTWHRLAAAIEDAGFEIRDSIAWLYGSGFPKSHDVSKAIDKAAGAEREILGRSVRPDGTSRTTTGSGRVATPFVAHAVEGDAFVTVPATPAAERWQGWGTALKPAFEPIVVGRKPLDGTVAANVLAHGTGALNIDGCRVGTDGGTRAPGFDSRAPESVSAYGHGLNGRSSERVEGLGRWPANVVLDDTQAAELDRQSGTLSSGTMRAGTERQARAGGTIYGTDSRNFLPADTYGDSGGASRFFPTFRYEAKAPTSERPRVGEVAHPTVKPLDLMRWLVRLVTPPGGVVLEPFAGSGTTAEACVLEGFRCIAIEREADYLPLIVSRLSKPLQLGLDLGHAS